MSYESENYLCDINYVQLRKAKLCQGYNLGKVKDEEHLLLACPNTQKVRERFCLALPLTHMSILVKFM